MIAMAVEEHKKEVLLAATNKKPSVQAAAVGKKVNFSAAAVAYDYWKKQERQQLFLGHCMERR